MPKNPPNTVKRTMPVRRPNQELRSRENLTMAEIDQLIKAARHGRNGHRDATMIMIGWRHVMRPGELVTLRWDQFDLDQGTFHVNRAKNGIPSVHPLSGEEIRALRKIKREELPSRYVFLSMRRGPMTVAGLQKVVARAGQRAGIPFKVHPHMLRHTGVTYLTDQGHDTRSIQIYAGHRNIQNTIKYSNLSSKRFEGFFND